MNDWQLHWHSSRKILSTRVQISWGATPTMGSIAFGDGKAWNCLLEDRCKKRGTSRKIVKLRQPFILCCISMRIL